MPELTGVAGLRVLDVSGPEAALCGKLLADLGADVVRAEPSIGSSTRRTRRAGSHRHPRARRGMPTAGSRASLRRPSLSPAPRTRSSIRATRGSLPTQSRTRAWN